MRQEDVAVTFPSRYWLAAALGVCVAHASGAWAAGGAPPPRLEISPGQAVPAASENQRLADAVAGQLRQSGRLHSYDVDVAVEDRIVRLTGAVADDAQRDEVLRITYGVPGVERVLDRLTVGGVAPARLDEAPPAPLPPGEPPSLRRNDGPPAGVVAAPGAEPVPMFQAPAPSPYDLNPPKMPGYAWPTYAPYNNYSRVAYPLAYPYNSWPFIGPCYPFPKVPLGWRSVKLEWDDGYWWYSKVATKYNWWHLRYW
jgi:hypothetical protein